MREYAIVMPVPNDEDEDVGDDEVVGSLLLLLLLLRSMTFTSNNCSNISIAHFNKSTTTIISSFSLSPGCGGGIVEAVEAVEVVVLIYAVN